MSEIFQMCGDNNKYHGISVLRKFDGIDYCDSLLR